LIGHRAHRQDPHGIAVAGEPAGHLADEDHVVELADQQPAIPAGPVRPSTVR